MYEPPVKKKKKQVPNDLIELNHRTEWDTWSNAPNQQSKDPNPHSKIKERKVFSLSTHVFFTLGARKVGPHETFEASYISVQDTVISNAQPFNKNSKIQEKG